MSKNYFEKGIIQNMFGQVPTNGLLEFMDENGFFEAPASRKYHGSYEGALYEHSMAVANNLINLTEKLGIKWKRPESPAIIGILHDLCKIDQYLLNDQGEYVWNEDQPIIGHGDKSCILAMRYMDLTNEEIMCIRYHMGAFEDANKYSDAVKKYPNVLFTHTADMMASHIIGI